MEARCEIRVFCSSLQLAGLDEGRPCRPDVCSGDGHSMIRPAACQVKHDWNRSDLRGVSIWGARRRRLSRSSIPLAAPDPARLERASGRHKQWLRSVTLQMLPSLRWSSEHRERVSEHVPTRPHIPRSSLAEDCLSYDSTAVMICKLVAETRPSDCPCCLAIRRLALADKMIEVSSTQRSAPESRTPLGW